MTSRRLAFAALIGAALAAPAFAADPAAVPAPELKAGDAWVYDATVERGSTGFGENHWAVQVEEVRDDTMIVGIKRQGAPAAFQDHEFGLDWSEHRLDEGRSIVSERPYDFPLAVGRSWTVDYDDPTRQGRQTSAHVHKSFKVVGWEDVVTPAGTFRAVKIEAHGTLKAQMAAVVGGVSGVAATAGDTTAVSHAQNSPAHVEYGTTYGATYYSPQVKSFVKSVHETYDAQGIRIRRETRVLESYKPAG